MPNSDCRTFSIAVALIRQNRKYLIGQRPKSKPQGGYWEFPGGKQKPGESISQALIRECREELDVLIQPEGPVLTTEYQYPDRQVKLHFWDARLLEGTPKPLAQQQLVWASPNELRNYPFCPANEEMIAFLQQRHIESIDHE